VTRAASENSAAGVADVTLQRRHCRHRVIIEIELVFLDQSRQSFDRKIEVADHLQQLGRDRIALHAAMVIPGQHIGPPV